MAAVQPRWLLHAAATCPWDALQHASQPPTRLTAPGTPLQNNLSELWSLLNYLLPDIFSNLADFEQWFDISAAVASSDENGDEQVVAAARQRARVVEKLHSLLKPFLLRRIKADVEIALPRKQELLLYAPMSTLQRQLNQQLLERTLADEMARVADLEGGSTASLGKLSNVLMQVRGAGRCGAGWGWRAPMRGQGAARARSARCGCV